MPMLMKSKDWIQTIANVSAAENVWYENISSNTDTVSLSLPGRGNYQVILVKTDMPQPLRKSGVKIGLMDGKWKLPTWDQDKAMDREIEADFEASLENPL